MARLCGSEQDGSMEKRRYLGWIVENHMFVAHRQNME